MWLHSIGLIAVAFASLLRRYVRKSLKQKQSQKRFVVLITGVSGCGKSTLAGRLADTLKAPIVHQDDHFSAPFVQYKDAIDNRMERPDNVDFNGIIKRVKLFAEGAVHVCPIVIIEGHTLLSSDDVVAMVDLIIFLNVENVETALKRRVGRRKRDATTNFHLSAYIRRFVWTSHKELIVPKLDVLLAQEDPRLHILRAEDAIDCLAEESLAIISKLRT